MDLTQPGKWYFFAPLLLPDPFCPNDERWRLFGEWTRAKQAFSNKCIKERRQKLVVSPHAIIRLLVLELVRKFCLKYYFTWKFQSLKNGIFHGNKLLLRSGAISRKEKKAGKKKCLENPVGQCIELGDSQPGCTKSFHVYSSTYFL